MSAKNFNFDPGNLRVESFKALPERREPEGTVRGYTHFVCTTETSCCGCGSLGCCEDDTQLSCF